MNRDSPLFIDDFSVGDRCITGDVLVTRDMIVGFAEVYDPQPMHLNDDAARATIFGAFVGSGWQTLSLSMRLLIDAKLLGGTPIVAVGFKDIRFHAPVLPDTRLRVETEVLSVRRSNTRNDRGYLELRVTTTASGTVVITQHWTLVVPARAVPMG